jgi:hypothetical protein
VTQAIWSRTEKFDYSSYAILAVTDLTTQVKPSSLWLNMQVRLCQPLFKQTNDFMQEIENKIYKYFENKNESIIVTSTNEQ